MVQIVTFDRFLDFQGEYYEGEPQQKKGLKLLYQGIREGKPPEELLTEGCPWMVKYSETPAPALQNLLTVPYFYQNDNYTGTGWRECWSSTSAMGCAFYGRVKTDDEYVQIARNYGDTTVYTTHVQACARFGIKATYRTDGDTTELKAAIDKGNLAAAGWSHNGPVTAPTDGLWCLIVGYDDAAQQWIMHDPNGEADMVGGGYITTANGPGKYVRYSYTNWNKRYMPYGQPGWYMTYEEA